MQRTTSELTREIIAGHVKEFALELDVSEEFVYQMLAGKHPDYLDRARRLHRVACRIVPEKAARYRNALDEDALQEARFKRSRHADPAEVPQLFGKVGKEFGEALQARLEGQPYAAQLLELDDVLNMVRKTRDCVEEEARREAAKASAEKCQPLRKVGGRR